jgi:3-hydroxybutyryl-CoA dehydratase
MVKVRVTPEHEPLSLTLDDITEGQEASFRTTIDRAAVEAFAALTGDVNPLHMDDGFAVGRGFERRVVHGALLGGYVSRLVGVFLPGRNCLLQSMHLKFLKPAYVGDEIEVMAVVSHVSRAVSVMVADIAISRVDDGERLATGQVQTGFTSERKVP